jgi:hypothetical protein
MLVFDLGRLPGQQSMLIFHALARIGVEALVLVPPKTPPVSIGYFQDAFSLEPEQNIDRVETFYGQEGIEAPGVEPKDFAAAMIPASSKLREDN